MISTVAFFVVLAAFVPGEDAPRFFQVQKPFETIEACEAGRNELFEQAQKDFEGHALVLDSKCLRINSAKEQSI